MRPPNSPAVPVGASACGPIRTTTPRKPIAKPMVRRRVIASAGIRTWASGNTISATEAIEMPAKLEVVYWMPQLSSMKGIAVLSAEMKIIIRQGAPARSANSRPPMGSQIAMVSAAALPIRAAASQKGVIPLSAISITMKVAPQISPRAMIISQELRVMLGAVMG